MKTAQFKERLSKAEALAYDAQMAAEELMSDLDEDQGSVSDANYDALQNFIDGCETTCNTVRKVCS